MVSGIIVIYDRICEKGSSTHIQFININFDIHNFKLERTIALKFV